LEWDCKPPADGFKLIDGMIGMLRSYGQTQFQAKPNAPAEFQKLADWLATCKITCRKPTGVQPPKDAILIPGVEGRPVKCKDVSLDLWDDKIACKRYCTFGECVKIGPYAFDPYKSKKLGVPKDMKCYFCKPSGPVESVVDDLISIGQQPKTQITTPQEPQPVDCEKECAQNGMSTTKPSSSGILAELQKYTCVSGASISIKSGTIHGCKCYAKAQISINTKAPVCKGTACGDVDCNSEKKCPCPNKPNCTLTVTCSWGGWKEIKEFTYQPVIGSV